MSAPSQLKRAKRARYENHGDDMLEALKDAKKVIGEIHMIPGFFIDRTYQKICNAIGKAEGK